VRFEITVDTLVVKRPWRDGVAPIHVRNVAAAAAVLLLYIRVVLVVIIPPNCP
jgi:hypothetical protein